MAKTSAVNRNLNREKMVKRDRSKRAKLKAQMMDRDAPVEERFEASMKLAEMPRNGSRTRVRLRCARAISAAAPPRSCGPVSHNSVSS